jgi:hypothetical protein
MPLKRRHFCPLYWPLHWLFAWWDHADQERRRKSREEKDQRYEHWCSRLPPVRPVKEVRPAKDTLPNTSTQYGSVFFCKLPLEIRQLIYTHLWDGEELLFQVPEEDSDNAPFTLTCPAAQGVLGFPMSCKRAYV